MRIFILFCLILNLNASDIKTTIKKLYKNGDFEQVCTLGFSNFQEFSKDEEFVSVYAFGCLYSDYIDRLSVPIASLKFSSEARANASYLSVVLMQKKLLFYSLKDNYNISKLNLPSTDYILSKVFDLYSKTPREQNDNGVYTLKDPADATLSYKLYLEKDPKLDKMVIEKLVNSISVEKHTYW